jgi:hypothetical protein
MLNRMLSPQASRVDVAKLAKAEAKIKVRLSYSLPLH